MKPLILFLFIFFYVCGSAQARPLGEGTSIPPDDGPYGYKGSTYEHSTKRGLWLGEQIQNVSSWVFYRVNFARLGLQGPHTPLCANNCSDLVFIRCNLHNVDVPTDSIIDGGQRIHSEVKLIEVSPGTFEKRRFVEGGDNVTRTYRYNPPVVIGNDDETLQTEELINEVPTSIGKRRVFVQPPI